MSKAQIVKRRVEISPAQAAEYVTIRPAQSTEYETVRRLVMPGYPEIRRLVTPGKPAMYEFQPYVRLTMSMDEAKALRAVLNRIGGNPEKSRRGLTEAISRALAEAGVKYQLGDGADLHGYNCSYGSMFFKDIHPSDDGKER